MSKIPSSVLSLTTMFLHVLAMPVFFMGFIMIYQSRWMIRLLEANHDMMVFSTLIVTCILIGVMCASRIPMTVCRKHIHLNWWQYTLWSLGEVIVFSCFAALFLALLHGSCGYFPALGQCLCMAFAILPYPYIIFAVWMAWLRPDEQEAAEENLVRFADNTGRLKLVIANNVILYIEAQENYISVHYMEGDTYKEYSLRQTMRGIEDLMARHGIVRCQRSYFINPRHIKVLRRDKEGMIQAELDVANTRHVPVSPKYYEQLSKML